MSRVALLALLPSLSGGLSLANIGLRATVRWYERGASRLVAEVAVLALDNELW